MINNFALPNSFYNDIMGRNLVLQVSNKRRKYSRQTIEELTHPFKEVWNFDVILGGWKRNSFER